MGSLGPKNVHGKNNCENSGLALKNTANQVLEKIGPLKKCATPAAKYRLKACFQRKQEGSKGFDCSRELIETIKPKERENCGMKLGKIRILLKQFENLTTGYEACLKLKP